MGETTFKMLKLSDKAKYWYEVASYAMPYATVASAIIGGLSFLEEREQNRKLDAIIRKLDEIENLIRKCKNQLEQKMEDVTLRQLTGEILGIREAMYESRGRENILEELVVPSAKAKSKARISITDESIGLEHRSAYCGLYCMLVPLRATILGMLWENTRTSCAEVIAELDDLLDLENVILKIIYSVGRNRVSGPVQVRTVDWIKTRMEMRHEREYFVLVDGIERTLIRRINGIMRQEAEEKREKLSENFGDEAREPFEEIFDKARNARQYLSKVRSAS